MSFHALVIGDLHWTGHQPVARTDAFRETLREKITECWDLAKLYQVNAIIQTGDVTHTPYMTLPVLADLASLLTVAPAPVYAVSGNHDALSPEAVGRTPYGFLRHLNLLKDVAEDPLLFPSTPPVYLSGRAYDAEVDSSPDWYAARVPEETQRFAPGVVQLHVAHGMLVRDSRPSRHTRLRDLLGVQHLPDVLITGHDHIGYGVERVGKTLCINPGALVRLTAAAEEIDRPVQVAMLEIGWGEIDARLIPLESARPGHEVLSREHLEREAAREAWQEEFLELLAAETQEQVLSLAEMVRDIARRERVRKEVRDEALALIARAQEEVARG